MLRNAERPRGKCGPHTGQVGVGLVAMEIHSPHALHALLHGLIPFWLAGYEAGFTFLSQQMLVTGRVFTATIRFCNVAEQIFACNPRAVPLALVLEATLNAAKG